MSSQKPEIRTLDDFLLSRYIKLFHFWPVDY